MQYHEINFDGAKFSLYENKSNGNKAVRLSPPLQFLSPPAVTNWPKVGPDGNFGTKYGPDNDKDTKFLLDLNSLPVCTGVPNANFTVFRAKLDALDNKLAEFVHKNQTVLLKRHNLSLSEIKILQSRSVKEKYDRDTGDFLYYHINLSTRKYNYAGESRSIGIYDKEGNPTQDLPGHGDVVSAAMQSGMVWIMGDKFGISWNFSDVCILAMREQMNQVSAQSAFAGAFEGEKFLTAGVNAGGGQESAA